MHLRYIVEVEKTKSITKAAQNLFMGQPNLSRAIRNLEKEIGMTIFRRTATGVESTRKGKEFLTYAQSILSQIDELESLYKKDERDSINLSISAPRATYISVAFSEFVNSLEKESDINIYFKETNSIGAINDVSCQESSLGIIRFQDIHENYFLSFLKDKKLAYELLWEFKMLLLMRKDHPLANLNDIPYEKLCDFIEIIHGDFEVPLLSSSDMKQSTLVKAPSRRIHVYERGSQFDLLQRSKGSFMWVSQIPEDFLYKHDLILKKASFTSAVNKDVIIYRKNSNLSCYEQMFIDCLKRQRDMLGNSKP